MTRSPLARPVPWAMIAPAVAILGILAAVIAARFGTTSDADLLYEEAITAFENGDHSTATAGLERVLALRDPTPLDWGLRARLAMADDRVDDALSALAEIPDGHALGSWARLTAGQLELRRNRLPAAEAALRAALELDPGLIQARRELIYILGMQSRRNELDVEFETLAKQSNLTYRETWLWCMVPDLIWWLPEEHVGTLQPCLEADPSDRWSRLALAEDFRRLARYDEARSILEPLPEADRDARALRAQLALELGDTPAAASLLASGPEDHPGLARLRGQIAMGRRDAREAVRQFTIVYRSEPDRRDSHSNLGRALLLAGDESAARPYLDAVEKYDALATLLLRAEGGMGDVDRQLMMDLGAACESVGRLPEARAWYAVVIAQNPLDREAQAALYRLRSANTTGAAPH